MKKHVWCQLKVIEGRTFKRSSNNPEWVEVELIKKHEYWKVAPLSKENKRFLLFGRAQRVINPFLNIPVVEDEPGCFKNNNWRNFPK